MNIKLVIFCFTLLKLSVGHEISEIVTLVSDFIVKLNVPTKITAYVCWSEDDRLLLWKKLLERDIIGQIRGTNNVNLSYTHRAEHQLFLIDINCKGSDFILKQAFHLNLFLYPLRWIIYGRTENSTLEDKFLRLDSRVFFIKKEDNRYHVQSPYKLSENLDFIQNDVAVWEQGYGFLRYNELSLSRNRTDLFGHNINISYVITHPESINHLEDYREKNIDSMSKLNYLVTKNLVRILNASQTKIYQPGWGYRIANSSRFNGMVGDLQTGVAEFGGTALFFTLDRFDVIDYIVPSVPSFTKFIFKAPPLSYVSNVFILPFDTYVWYCCYGILPVILGIIYIIVKWEWNDPLFKEKEAVNSVAPLRPSLFDVIVLELGAITQQGAESEPKSGAGRIATVFAFIACMFLYTAYSANIVALLQSTTESIRTLEDLLNSRISLGVEDLEYARYWFKAADDPVGKAIYQQKVAPRGQKPNFMTVEEGMSRVQKGYFAFYTEATNGYKVVADTFQENEKCSLKEILYITINEPYLAIKKRSAYKEIVRVGLRKIWELGIERREIHKLYTMKPVCQSSGSSFGSAALLDCYFAFVLYGVGVVISVFMFFLEIMIQKENKRRNAIMQ